MTWMPKWCRAVVALLSVTAMTLLFVMPVAWFCTWFGWLPRAQLLPAIMSGEMTALALIAVSVALFGRLYCAVVCPLGIAQDVARFPLKFFHLKGLPIVGWVRYAVLAVAECLRDLFPDSFMKAYVYDFIRDVTKGTDVKFIDYWDDAEFQDERLYATSLFLNKTGRRRFTKKVMGDCIMKSNGDVK